MHSVWQSLDLSCGCKSNYPILFNGCVIFHCMCVSCLTFWHWLTPAPSFPGVLSEWPSPSIICSFSLLSNTPMDLLCAMVCLTTRPLKDVWSMWGSHMHSFWEHCWAGFSVSMSFTALEQLPGRRLWQFLIHTHYLFNCSVLPDSLWLHGLQHSRLPCPSPTPRVCSNSCPLSWWCHPTISSSVTPFSSCPQSFLASGSFPMNQLFTSDGQSISASISASVLPMNIQGWFPLGLTGLISLPSKGLTRVFCSTTVQKHQFFVAQPS